MIPIHISVRGVIFATAIVAILGILVIRNNSKAKSDYKISKGKIEFLEKKFQNLPNRDFGKFRYLKIESYPYLFEIYEPNSEKTKFTIDDLKRGDLIDIYYYETSDTRSSGINRFAQFIDRNSEPYFIRNGFQKQLGYIILILILLINIMALIFWRKGKLNW
jgi:hypothetical protein